MSGELIIGLMSGTSTDGIDAVLVQFESVDSLQVLSSVFVPYSAELQSRINHFAHSTIKPSKPEYGSLDRELANLYALASMRLIEESDRNPSQIEAIANHGQTIAHDPNAKPPYSLQIGDGQIVANQSGLKVISQFRQADIENGGQGAPLMPAFHQAVFATKSTAEPVFILNLGGIANLTYLGETVIGFDTGPANTLMNQWVKQRLGKDFDEGGKWAGSGTVIPHILNQLLNDPYFDQAYPKSTGPDYLNLDWLEEHVGDVRGIAEEDIQATLLELSVETIALGLQKVVENQELGMTGTIYVCGGGAKNTVLLSRLADRLPSYTIALSDELGVPADWVEAAGFAWLGYCYLNNIESNLPSVTGARKSLILGQQFIPEEKT